MDDSEGRKTGQISTNDRLTVDHSDLFGNIRIWKTLIGITNLIFWGNLH